jgi:hypothetical protein
VGKAQSGLVALFGRQQVLAVTRIYTQDD